MNNLFKKISPFALTLLLLASRSHAKEQWACAYNFISSSAGITEVALQHCDDGQGDRGDWRIIRFEKHDGEFGHPDVSSKLHGFFDSLGSGETVTFNLAPGFGYNKFIPILISAGHQKLTFSEHDFESGEGFRK